MSWDRLQAPAPRPLTLVPREVDKWTEPTLSLPTDPWGGQGQWECGGGLVSEPLPRAQGAAWEARFAFLWGPEREPAVQVAGAQCSPVLPKPLKRQDRTEGLEKVCYGLRAPGA